MNPSILYEDVNYVILNKPAGLVVHSDGRTQEPALTDWIIEHYPDTKDVGEPSTSIAGEKVLRPGIVHRLDKDTSGAIVVVKNTKAFADLKEKFQNRLVDKKYHAFVYGHLADEDGTINRPIGRSKNDFRLWSAQRGARGEMREAVTNYKVLVHGEDKSTGQKFDFVEVEPKTGRTHQIRVHLKAIHHPVIADSLYAPKQQKILGFERLALHAFSISFIGIDGKMISGTAPYPQDFEKAVKLVQKQRLT